MGRALRQTSFISILPKNSLDSSQKGKKNKYSVVNSCHHLFISATNSGVPTTYYAVCRAVGTLDESDTAPTPRLLANRHGNHSHKPAWPMPGCKDVLSRGCSLPSTPPQAFLSEPLLPPERNRLIWHPFHRQLNRDPKNNLFGNQQSQD